MTSNFEFIIKTVLDKLNSIKASLLKSNLNEAIKETDEAIIFYKDVIGEEKRAPLSEEQIEHILSKNKDDEKNGKE